MRIDCRRNSCWPLARQQDPVLAARLAAMPSNDADLAAAIGAGPVVLGMIASPETTGKTLRAPPFLVSDVGKRVGMSAATLNRRPCSKA